MLASSQLSESNLYIDDRCAVSIRDIRSAVYQTNAIHEISLVIVDYLQLCKCSQPGLNRTDQVEYVSGGLKDIAREFNVPVIAVSQLSRASADRTGHRPVLSDLRQSGAIEQDADLVLFVHRENYYDKTAPKTDAELIIAKQRDGETGTVHLYFNPSVMQFASVHKGINNGPN